MSCCTSIKNLGCLQSCDLIQFGETAMQTGDYTVETQPDNKRIYTTENTAGNPLFLTNRLNEDGTTVFKVILPDGTYFTASSGEDCFQVTNSIANDPTKANTTINPVACADATAVLKNTVPTILSTTPIVSGVSQDITAPDANYRNSDSTFTQAIASDVTFASADINITQVDLSVTTSPTNKNITCNPALCPQTTSIIFNPLAITDDTSALFTNPGTTMTLTAISDDGSSGTITVSVNGGSFAAFVNPTTVLITQTLQVKRTITTGVGTVTITGTYA